MLEACCLLLDKRARRRADIEWSLKQHGLRASFFVCGDGSSKSLVYDRVDTTPPPRSGYPAWAERANSWNAFQCFREMVKRAKAGPCEALLVLEDDVVLLPRFGEALARGVYEAGRHDHAWRMLYLGANHAFSRTEEVKPGLLKVNGSGCFHAVVLHRRVFDEVLSLPQEGPIDGQAAKHIHPLGGCYAVWPNAAVTEPGFSHCEGRDVDYSEFWGRKGC